MHYAAMLDIVNKHYFEHYLIWLWHTLYHPIKLYININPFEQKPLSLFNSLILSFVYLYDLL